MERGGGLLRLFKKDKTAIERPVHPPQPTRKPQEWDRVNLNSTEAYLEMAAETLQEAMNVASADMDSNSLLNIAKEWSTLAECADSMKHRLPRIGFKPKEEQD
jgi:hypothetical protein